MRVYNKRCSSTVTVLFFIFFGIILALFFYFAVTLKVKSAVADTSYHKKFYSRDLALLVDSMHAANGDMVMNYEIYTKGDLHLDTNLQLDRVFITDNSNTPMDKRAKTFFRFGYNDRIKVVPSQRDWQSFSFSVVLSNESLWFGTPSGGDVKLKELPASGENPPESQGSAPESVST